MKARKTILIPIALGLMMSGCTTSSRQQTDSVIEPTASSTESASQTPTPKAVVSEKEIGLEKEVALKTSLIDSLQKQLADNKRQLASLNKSLDEKDIIIANLQKSSSNAKSLAELEEQKKLRELLESRYSALKLDNDLLTRRISQLENENTSLKQQVSSLENMPTTQDGFKQSYLDLLSENTQLQKKYANLEADNQANQKRLTSLKKENLMLGGALSDARAQHQVLWDKIRSLNAEKSVGTDSVPQPVVPIIQPASSNDSDYERENAQMRIELADLQSKVAEQKALIDEYKSDILKLESALDEGADYEARWKDLDNKLAQAQQKNAALTAQLNATGEQLAASQTELNALSARLASTQQALEVNENSGISVTAAIEALQSQMSSALQNVQWQLPNEIALHNNFEILVSADVQPSLSGQTYLAELVTDSDIQMISDRIASAVVQNGRLQWRWRVAGLNEKPEAQLNLFVNQQIAFQDQTIQRQVYRGNETLSLINTNLFEKYGYWGIAILLGLLGGFLIGRINKSKNNQELNS
ncbi:hypothetical protein [Marinomonas sp.]|uniref:hypothetical protein n=1 Tax=Marinomonas sp. TaxID=1904862 RepID=UPI003BAB0DF7